MELAVAVAVNDLPRPPLRHIFGPNSLPEVPTPEHLVDQTNGITLHLKFFKRNPLLHAGPPSCTIDIPWAWYSHDMIAVEGKLKVSGGGGSDKERANTRMPKASSRF